MKFAATVLTMIIFMGTMISMEGCNQPRKEAIKTPAAPGFEAPRKSTLLMVTGDTLLSAEQQDTLLALARRSMTMTLLSKGKLPAPRLVDTRLKQNQGCLVMVTREGKVLGTSGYALPIMPLVDGVIEMANRMAAAIDPAQPIQPADIPKTVIVITAISDPVEIKGPEGIHPGKNGLVIIKSGSVRSVLLPEEVLMAGSPVKAIDKLLTNASSTRDDLTKGEIQVFSFTIQRFSDVPQSSP